LNEDWLPIKCSVAWEDPSSSALIDNTGSSKEFYEYRQSLMDIKDNLVVIENPIILSDPYIENYFHFCLEIVPRLRFFAGHRQSTIIIPTAATKKTYQTDLLMRVREGRPFLPIAGAFIARNPLLAHGLFTEDGLRWLRDATRIRAAPGKRRVYIRRSAKGTRSTTGGGISEGPEFLSLIQEFGLEVVEFGDGDLSVEAQAAMLDGAGVILAAHGAALTNLAFLSPPVSVVEIVGIRTCRAVFRHICEILGLRYHGLIASHYDSEGNVVVDAARLREFLASAIG
jgi:capsular polysaccharide biosynthesis protein